MVSVNNHVKSLQLSFQWHASASEQLILVDYRQSVRLLIPSSEPAGDFLTCRADEAISTTGEIEYLYV